MPATDVSINATISYKGRHVGGGGEGERITPAFGKSRDCSAFVKFNYWQISSAAANTQQVPNFPLFNRSF